MKLRYCLALVAAVALGSAGCDSGLVDVKGVVTLDGNPVEGATVTFTSEDGKTIYNGFTDSTGTFTLKAENNKSGVKAGQYKVTVVKHSQVKGGEAMDPSSPEAMKTMMKESKVAEGRPAPGKPAMMMPGMKMGMKGGGIKSELPAVYALPDSTPITVKVPPDKQPIPIELNSKS